jgi:Xaa-Pro dipeptidase
MLKKLNYHINIFNKRKGVWFMQLEKQLKKITELMVRINAEVYMVGPSSGLEYLTGINPHPDERFKGLFILKDGRHFYVAPELYYEETRELLGESEHIIIWSDTDGFLSAIKKADDKYEFKGKVIAVNDGILAINMLDIAEAIGTKFINGNSILEDIRVSKTEEEKDCMRKAARIADEVVEETINYIKPGLLERDIAKKIEELFAKHGVGLSFSSIVASGPNTSKPHYTGDSRVIQDQDIIIIDTGCRYKGYCSDISRTIFVGEPTKEQRKIFEICVKATTTGEMTARKGVTAEEVDIAARNVIKDAGYGDYFLNRTGHGIGVAVHEAPYIKTGNKQILDNGMCFSIEPGIYLTGKFGMRVENIVLIENGKAEILNKVTKEIIIVK